mgnify:CR=1 FL=1
MSMRKQFTLTMDTLLSTNEKVVLLLGDIGVFGFKKAFETYPERVYNIGILEQSTVSAAAGLSMTSLIPVVHTIAPFLVERCVEQLKDDFGYQKLGGNFVSVGGSYDYAALGGTHHCPADVEILKSIPGMEIIVPGTAKEFNALLISTYSNGKPTYFRLSERENSKSYDVQFGKAHVIKKGNDGTIVVVGPMLNATIEAAKNANVTILYYTTVAPFDTETLKNNCSSGKILLVEPFYEGTLVNEIIKTLKGRAVQIEIVGVPREFLTNYGKAEEHDTHLGLTSSAIQESLEILLS